MKYFYVILAFLIFLKPISPVLEYIINYDYIANVLCENKNKPQLKCNGKCHLMKELAKASESEKPISSDKKSSFAFGDNEVLFLESIQEVAFGIDFCSSYLEISTHYSNLYDFSFNPKFLHPPIFV